MFDVVLPTYNNLSELKRCLKALEKQSFKENKIFVCVDGSTDGTLEYLQNTKFDLDLKVLEHPDKKNNGRNLTRNLCIPYLSSKYLLLLDSDCIPKPDLIEKHKNILDQKDVISVGEIFYTNTKANIWAKYLQTRGKGKYKNGDIIPSHYLNTQNVAFLTKYFLESGGQDLEMSKSYGGDDTELGYRLNKQFGLELIFNKSAVAFSEMTKTLDKALLQMEEFGNVNLKLIRKKHPELSNVFRADLLEGNSSKNKLMKLVLSPPFSNIIKFLFPLFIGKLKVYVVHYLVMSSILKGYSSHQSIPKIN